LTTDNPNTEPTYHYFTDNMPTEPPNRAVSVVPSMTETLFELGLATFLVGVSDDCRYPAEGVQTKFRVGPIEQLNIQHIVDLRPDVVIVNREENTLADIARLQDAGLHVWQTFPRTVMDAMNLIWDTLHLFMVEDRYLYEKVNLINRTIDWVGGVSEANEDHICKVFVPMLPEPLTTFGSDTYAHDLLRVAGGTNTFGDYAPTPDSDPAEDLRRYPTVMLEEVQAAQPDVILLPGSPLSFLETDIMWFNQQLDVPATRNQQVYLIDGSLFTYHSTRLARALNEISALMCDLEA
jgi:ABC-type Fe3+-hydroxamate transport system substrate-binding protein